MTTLYLWYGLPYVSLIICKSALFIFISAEQSYLVRQYIYPHWIKHPCSIRAWVPVSFFLFLSLSFSQANSLECRSPLSSLSCPGLQDPHERAPYAYVKQCKPRVKGFIGFLCKPRNISLFLFLFYFLIIDSGPPGSGPLKDLNTIVYIYHLFFIHSSFSGHLGCFYVPAVHNIFIYSNIFELFPYLSYCK